jgi:hypothetical protein
VLDLSVGSVVSYPAGGSDLDPERGRVLDLEVDVIAGAMASMPGITQCLGSGPPVVIQAYPAALGRTHVGVFVDTYMRSANVARALGLAARRSESVVFLGQPLSAADLLLDALARGVAMPRRMLLVLGGYACPATLESWLVELLAEHGALVVRVLHAYGCAELGAGTLLGWREAGAAVRYRVVDPMTIVECVDGALVMSRAGRTVATGDDAERVGDEWYLQPGPGRLAKDVQGELETWNGQDWGRRTGFLARREEGFVFQLRRGESVENANEIDHYAFCREWGMSWLDKPNWA